MDPLAIGRPIVGVPRDGPPERTAAAARMLLHATALAFDHPHSGSPLVFECPAPF